MPGSSEDQTLAHEVAIAVNLPADIDRTGIVTTTLAGDTQALGIHGISNSPLVGQEVNTAPASIAEGVVQEKLEVPAGADARASHETFYELEPIHPHAKVGSGEQVVRDSRTGKHYVKRKKPAYSLARAKGAPTVQPQQHHGAQIGLAHPMPLGGTRPGHHSQRTTPEGSYRGTPKSSGGGFNHGHESYHAPSAATSAAIAADRHAMLQQMRTLIHEEVSRANLSHAEELKRVADQVEQLDASPDTVQAMLAGAGGGNESPIKKEDRDTVVVSGNDVSTGDLTQIDDIRSEDDMSEAEAFPNAWARIRYRYREYFAEFLGTMILLTFGAGINNQVFVSALIDPSAAKGTYLSVSFGWGIGVCMGIYVSGGISGGHINPAVTISLACFRGFPWRKVPGYVIAQVAGAFMGALCIYGMYVNPIRVVDPNQTETTAGLFTTYPASYLRSPSTRMTAVYNEVYATAILLMVVLAIGDAENTPPVSGTSPLVLLFLILGIGATMGWQTAYCLNPARDLGPRLMLWVVGYSPSILWTFNAWYWIWTPIISTIIGGLLGAFIYDSLIYTGTESPINKSWPESNLFQRRKRELGDRPVELTDAEKGVTKG